MLKDIAQGESEVYSLVYKQGFVIWTPEYGMTWAAWGFRKINLPVATRGNKVGKQ